MIAPISFSSKYKIQEFNPRNIQKEYKNINKKECRPETVEHKISLEEKCYEAFFEEVSQLRKRLEKGDAQDSEYSAIPKILMELDKIKERAIDTGDHSLYSRAALVSSDLIQAISISIKPKKIDIEKLSSKEFQPIEKYPFLVSQAPPKIQFIEEYDLKTGKWVIKPTI